MNKETLKRVPLSSAYRNSAAVLPWMLCAATLMAAGPARAGGVLPTNGQYVAGQGSITSAAGSVTVNQTSSHGIINWQNFSIGQGNSVLFNNGSGATLNRVTGNQISQIDGSLKATGSVYLINPQGIVIGPNGQVIANGSFVASTRDVSNSAFMSGEPFSASGTSNGAIVNQGVITSNTGDAILVGSSVTNTGSISAPNGTVGLAAGNEITLQPAGSDSRVAISGGTGSVTNSGNLKAAQAELNAAGGNVYALVENNGGAISATGTTNVGGHVWLTAGGTGTVTVSGTVNAQNANGSGGDVTVRGTNISIPGAINAAATSVNGSGGSVSVVASNTAAVSGSIHAGGGASGQGGMIETSGHTLSFGGADIDAGHGGSWLLDPYDLTVTSSAATTIDNSLNAGTSVTLETTATGTSGPGTANSSGSGNINIDAPLSWNTSATLTLNAYANITFAANLNIQKGGGLVMVTNSGGAGGDYFIDPGDSIQFPNGGALTINGAAYTLLYSAQQMVSTILNGSNPDAPYGDYALAMPVNEGGYVLSTPIGYYIGSTPYPFYGTFTGLGNTISNLVINGAAPIVGPFNGLFGYVAGGAVVRNLGLINETVEGPSAGGLVYENFGTLEYDFTTGTASTSGGVGGLVNYNAGTVANSYSSMSVYGASGAGGLVFNNGGTIADSYATGAVTGTGLGGLVYYNTATITSSYATGAVVGGGYMGGLVGNNQGGTITLSYATGDVVLSGSGTAGGLLGLNAGSISGSFWDTSTTGQGSGIGSGTPNTVTPLTTAQFQNGSLPSGFASSVWATGTGLYPYLKGIYPNGVSAISGTAYSKVGGTTVAGETVSVDTGGNYFTSASSGADGYYYAFGAPIAAGSSVLAYTGPSTGATNAGTYVASSAGALGLSGVNVYGNTFTATSPATTYSSLMTAAAGNDANALSAIEGAQNDSITATGASFTINEPLNLTGNLAITTTASNASITVADPITLTGTGALTLDAAGNIAFNADLTAAGADALSFTTGSGDSYSLEFGDTISFTGGPSAGASLSINGNAYTLLYSMGDVQNINNNLGGTYALAISLNAATDPTTPASWAPIGTDGQGNVFSSPNGFGFRGTFAGLGNTISNLTVNIGSNAYAGLFGYSIGTIRDVGIIGGSVTGGYYVGGLVGLNARSVQNSYATATVSGTTDVGGLVGLNNGTTVDSYATGAVTTTGALGYAGGLVGLNESNITQSYATGTVTGDNVSIVGGLVGYNYVGRITQSYATGAVVGGGYGISTGIGASGGLVGSNNASITDSYATGHVTYTGGPSFEGPLSGGLVGSNSSSATITDSFWDAQTTGQAVGIGIDSNSQSGNVTGLTTAQLQGTLPGTFSSSVWSTGAGLYPYLTSFFPNGIAVITGTAQGSGSLVSIDVNGSNFGTASIGANGMYYAFGQPFVSGSSVLAAESNVTSNAATFTPSMSGTGSTGFNLVTNTLTVASTPATSLSTLDAQLDAAAGSDTLALAAIANAQGLNITSTGAGFTIDEPLNTSAGVSITMSAANAPITVAKPIAAGSLVLDATGALAFDADVQITGSAGASSFTTGAGDDYTIASGDSITFTGPQGSQTLAINGTPYTLIFSMGGLEAANNNLGGNYALATSLNATTDSTTPASWTPIGPSSLNYFSGTFAGLGNTISNLVVTLAGQTGHEAGLFGYSTGTIRDLGLIGGSVTGGYYSYYIGALAGESVGGTIRDVYATTTVNATGPEGIVGGLVGASNGTISDSYATGAVNASGAFYAGGLVAYNAAGGTVSNSYATGAVTGAERFSGGLVGYNSGGTITQSYATGEVSGVGADTGGLVGASEGTISDSFATGAVSGTSGSTDGGLVGYASGQISNSYATGAVSGTSGSLVGGLIGYNAGQISDTYATGAINASGAAGGLVGQNYFGAITASFWDVDTSGTNTGIGQDNNNQSRNVTGLTTAQLQSGTLPSGFSSSIWSTGTGLYPYLTSFFPNGVSIVTGTAYSGTGTVLAGAAIGVDVGGNYLGSGSAGANGYYYVFGQPVAAGSSALAYIDGTTSSTLVQNASSSGTSNVVLVNNGLLNTDTSATLLSQTQLPSYANLVSLANAAAGDDANALAAISGATGQGLIATGTSFMIDQPLAVSANFTLQTISANAPITVSRQVTVAGGDALTLDATGNVVFDANVTVNGDGALAITTGAGDGYSIGSGGSIDFTGGDGSGASLTINGTPYTLVYTAADLEAINNNLNGDYALADDVDASSVSNWTPLGTNGHGSVLNGSGFAGTFAGLGNTLSNVTVNIGSSSYAGVFGVSSGTVRDLIVANADVTGGASVGALIGENLGSVQNASVENSTVTGSGYGTGGFVGLNTSSGSITASAASALTVSGDGGTGGFVGLNSGTLGYDSVVGSTIGNSTNGTGGFAGQNAATGNIANSSVTSSVVDGQNVTGGFVGNNAGMIETSSISTTTSGTAYAITGIGYVGGFAGENVAGAVITGSSSANTGANAVYGSGDRIGGFIGWNAGTLSGDHAGDAVNGAAQVGGLIGWNDGNVSGSSIANASVTGSQFGTGGFVGYNATTGGVTSSTVASVTVSGAGGVGGFAGLNGGSLSSDGVSGSTVSDSASGTGGFVGQNAAGGTITDSTVEGALTAGSSASVNGGAATGGFVGANYGTISSSGVAATATSGSFSVDGASYVGGFAGINETGGTISGSSVGASGTTTGTGNRVGGFVGWNASSSVGVIGLTGDEAADAVSGGEQVGGLVGWNDGAISESSASGTVAGTSDVGGLVGYNTATGTIDQSFATGPVTGATFVGGLVGDNFGGITNAYATGAVGTSSTTDVGGLVGGNSGAINDVYAAAIVVGQSGSTGALVGYNAPTGSIGNAIPGTSTAYYDAGVTGSLAAIGDNLGRADIVALGGAGEQDPTQAASYVNFDFTDVWTIAPDGLPTLMHAP